MAEVVLEHLCMTYPRGVHAVRDVSIAFKSGELCVVLGPSGSGKTTTLRLIAGLEKPSAGSIRIDSHCVDSWPPWQRNVAMVFQRPALYPEHTVRQNLILGLRLRGEGRLLSAAAMNGRIAEVAAMLGIADVLERRPGQLSGGQQQRVALGRALVRKPSVLLMDEPLSQLDAPLRCELRRELHLLQRQQQTTMVYVTHDQEDALALADRIAIMNQGEILQVAKPDEAYNRPGSRFVAAFLGSPSMCFLEGRIERDQGGASFVCGKARLTLPPRALVGDGIPLDRPTVIGFRPENLELAGPGETEASLPGMVSLLEGTGPMRLVSVVGEGWRVTLKPKSRQGLRNDDSVHVGFHWESAHVFDRETGLALWHGWATG